MSSTDLPWYKEYATNTLAQTLELDFEELGIYQHLKLKYWCERETGLSEGVVNRIKSKCDDTKFHYIITTFFVLENGFYHHKELREQIEKQKENSLRQKKIKVTNIEPLGNLKVTSSEPLSSSSSSSSSNNNTTKKPHPIGFELFWKDIKNKIGVGHARKAFNKLPDEWQNKPIELQKLYNEHCEVNKKFSKHPATWLNGECYLDNIVADTSPEEEQEFQEKMDRSNWEHAKKMGGWWISAKSEMIRRCEDKYGKINP